MTRFTWGLAIAAMALLLRPVAEAAELAPQAWVAKKAAIIELMHSKARKALVTAAQDTRYHDYLTSTSDQERAQIKNDIDTISLEVQSHFHVEEMCLIDPTGTEISRIVGNAIAHDLDTGESDNVFFEPGFRLKVRTVYISPIYMSGDADKWVVAYVTPIVVGGETRAILHYEHGLDVYQDALNKNFSGEDSFIVAVSSDGWVISDSRRSIATAKKSGSESPADYFAPFAWEGMNADQLKARIGDAGFGTIAAGRERFDVAYAQVEQWTLFVIVRR